jgi:hypothetical protein
MEFDYHTLVKQEREDDFSMPIPTSISARSGRLAIALNREELYVVMHLLKAEQLPGFALDWLQITKDGNIPGDIRRTLEVATNDLVARGYIGPVKRPVGMEPVVLDMPSPVVALVGACAFSEYTGVLSLRRTPDGPRVIYLHGLRELGVIHSMPYPDVHQFEAVEERRMIEALEELLQLHAQPACELASGAALAADVEQARDLAAGGNVDEAAAILARGGLSVETAQAFARGLQKASIIGTVLMSVRTTNNQLSQRVWGIVVTPEICFLLGNSDSTTLTFYVRAIAADTLRDQFATYLSSLHDNQGL